MKRLLSALLILLLLPLPYARAESAEGKTLSILGDSISTYAGFSDDADANVTIGGYRLFYPRWGNSVEAEDTWWYQTAEQLGLRLLVNNSFSGSCLLRAAYGAEGAYVDRCTQLHSNEGEEPDIIAIYLGTNDYYAYPDTLGSYEGIDFTALIRADGYAQPRTTMEAYAITLHKIRARYPDAQVYCFTLLPLGGSDIQPDRFNEDIRQLSEHFGCHTVDLSICGIVPEVHMGDALHPEKAGMDAITAAFVSAILEADGTESCAAVYSLTDTASTAGTAKLVQREKPFATELIPLTNQPYLEISVTMAGVDITPYCLKDGKISIANVVGDLTVTAKPVSSPPIVSPPDLTAMMGSMLLGCAAIVS